MIRLDKCTNYVEMYLCVQKGGGGGGGGVEWGGTKFCLNARTPYKIFNMSTTYNSNRTLHLLSQNTVLNAL